MVLFHVRWRRPLAVVAGTILVLGPHATLAITPSTDERRGVENVLDVDELRRGGVFDDATFYGGVDAGGVAIEGGIWDFEDGSLQGWTSVDLSDTGVFVRRVAAPFIGAITQNDGGVSSTASIWFGANESEAAVGCWPGGLGYSNSWIQRATKTLTYSGSGSPVLEFDYFVDSETQFDYTYVYVVQGGEKSPPLNTSAWANPDTGLGYSGGGDEGTAIGSPSDPAHESIEIDPSYFPDGAGDYDLVFEFDSDPIFSDGLDSFSGFFDSEFGPFGFDAVEIDGVTISDFELSDDGWVFSTADPIGSLLAVSDLDDLAPIDDPCNCPLTVAGNGYAMTAFDEFDSHPEGQDELLISPPAYVGGTPFSSLQILVGAYEDLPFDGGVGYRVGVHYYPWTCPTTGVVGWTTDFAGSGGFNFAAPPQCGLFLRDLSGFVPTTTDSVQLVIKLLSDCPDFGVAECDPSLRNQSPYFDDLQLFTLPPIDTPSIGLDIVFGDRFPTDNSIQPSSPVDAKSVYDNNRADLDPTNADMGDSAVVFVNSTTSTRVFMNFRVFPGPETDTSDPFFSRYGGNFLAPGGTWARARMDSAESSSGWVPHTFATYLHEDAGGVEGSPDYKILADGVLTPGTTVEYFFTADFGAGMPEAVTPDTSGGFYLEWEALPGYFEASGTEDVLAPCTLYIDADNAGAQEPIETHGFGPYLGAITDANGVDHNGWDRFDHVGSSSNAAAPFARERFGDNGMTKFQSYAYETIVINTGSAVAEGLRDGDAELLLNWATNDDTALVQKGLWLNGSGAANMLDRPFRPNSQLLLSTVFAADHRCFYGGECAGDDASDCVRLDPTPGANFGTSVPYAAATGVGCPTSLGFDVMSPVAGGVGDLVFVDQDAAGQPAEAFASISNDQFSSAARYGAVIDGFSLHRIVGVASDFAGGTALECGDDPSAITQRVDDVFSWMGLSPSGELCDVGSVVDAPPGHAVAPARTTLHQNSPNPFNPTTTIRYDLHVDAEVSLRIFDVAGTLVRTLVDGGQVADRYAVRWDGTTDAGHDVTSGVFWARLTTSNGFRASTKMVVLK